MCGIAGLIAQGSQAELERLATAMASAIAYRGPDGAGVWADAEAGVALSHRRLAIVDLTPTGAQPMVSADGRWVMSYNGEVYNAEAIARAPQMAGLVRRGTSDTEVILESVARRGLDATLADLNGMFAIALWDRATRTLHLVRDRMGIKPLFYARTARGTFFASELKSFHAAGLALDFDPDSVASFLRYGYVPAPYAVHRGVMKVMPGEIVSLDGAGAVKRRRYWSLETAAREGAVRPFAGDDREAEDALQALLADAVSLNLMSDVPLGAFLSGGIDSSLVAALMVAAGRGPVRTFSIGFPDFGYDESAHAAAVAKHLGTAHEQMTVTAAEALAVVPSLPDIYDEPFADSSQIPTYLVSRMTRARVTVALSGDGGDELFAGYNRHVFAAGRLAMLRKLPRPLRRSAAALLSALPDAGVEGAARLLPPSLRVAQPALKLQKLAEVLARDGDDVWRRLVSQNDDVAALMPGVAEHPLALPDVDGDLLARMQVYDAATYLPDDILQKVDRAAMAVSLEVRPPLLDHRVAEFALALPARLRIRDGESKWLLRRVLDRYVPRSLVERPKMGFAVPLDQWLRGPLRDWAEDLLDPQRLDLLDAVAVRRLWDDHLTGRANHAYGLWAVLMLEAWRRRWNAAPGDIPLARTATAG
ncbi:MAG: asparagine synthase (glutamine-hydrolyzing) [Pseudolabrys sp.]|nr:asparagine synthase (glutamine-hydrolyzing) [Pseudolabrys sp.]